MWLFDILDNINVKVNINVNVANTAQLETTYSFA